MKLNHCFLWLFLFRVNKSILYRNYNIKREKMREFDYNYFTLIYNKNFNVERKKYLHSSNRR